MAAELQSLLDKIQSEGVEKANEKAKSILEKAEKEAAATLASAEKKSADLHANAEADAAVLRERAEQAVRQAARDIVIGVGQSIQQTLERVLLKNLDEALSGDFLQTFLEKIVKAVASQPDAAGGIEVLVPREQADKLAAFAAQNLTGAVAGGLKIAPATDVKAGIRVMTAGGRIEHDFTNEAIMAAMSKLMSPALTKMIFDKQ